MATELPLEITCRDVANSLGQASSDLLLLDCREVDEHAVAHIEGALLLPMGQLSGRIAELEIYRDRPIAVHCHHGGRSLKVAQWLRQQGFSLAQSMAGGIDEWAREIDTAVPRY